MAWNVFGMNPHLLRREDSVNSTGRSIVRSGVSGTLPNMRFALKLSAVVGLALVCAAAWLPPRLGAQGGGQFMGTADDAAIAYSTAPVHNLVEDLNKRLEDGSATLAFNGRSGY